MSDVHETNPGWDPSMQEAIGDILDKDAPRQELTARIDALHSEGMGRPMSNIMTDKKGIAGIIIPVSPEMTKYAVLIKNGAVLIIECASNHPLATFHYRKIFSPSPTPFVWENEHFADLGEIAADFEEGKTRFGSKVVMRNDEAHHKEVEKLVDSGIKQERQRLQAQNKPKEVTYQPDKKRNIISGEITIFDRTINFSLGFGKRTTKE